MSRPKFLKNRRAKKLTKPEGDAKSHFSKLTHQKYSLTASHYKNSLKNSVLMETPVNLILNLPKIRTQKSSKTHTGRGEL